MVGLFVRVFSSRLVMGLNFRMGSQAVAQPRMRSRAGSASTFSGGDAEYPRWHSLRIWTAIGAAGAVLIGIFVLGEPANVLRLAGIVVMLKLAEG